MVGTVLMAALMQDLRLMHPPVRVVTGDCIALPLPGDASLVMLELERNRLVSFGYYLQDPQGLPVPDPEFLFYVDAHGQWFPLAITRYLDGKTEYITCEYGRLTVLDPTGQAKLAAYADIWAMYVRNLLGVPLLTQKLPSAPEPHELSAKMQQFINTLATHYAVDLTRKGAWLRLVAGEAGLLIKSTRIDHVAVIYGYQTGEGFDLDTEMVFSTSCDGWLPVEIINSSEVWANYEQWAESSGHVQIYNAAGDMCFAGFTEYWAEVLAALEWTFVDCRLGDTQDE